MLHHIILVVMCVYGFFCGDIDVFILLNSITARARCGVKFQKLIILLDTTAKKIVLSLAWRKEYRLGNVPD